MHDNTFGLSAKGYPNRKGYFLLLGVYLCILATSCAVLYFTGLMQFRAGMDGKIKRILDDVSYRNNTWQMSNYNSDPTLLGIDPLYLITVDGYILDRRSPIHGFLDTADFNKLLTYQTIRTSTTISNQTRRIYSLPIQNGNRILGVLAVSYFNPNREDLSYIDNYLKKTIHAIASNVKIKNGEIDVSGVDDRKIPYDIAYTIVDRYNTILKKTTNVNNIKRIPNFIDTSYVKKQLESQKEKIITDNQTGKVFLTETDVIKDKQGVPLGFITLGMSLMPLYEEVANFAYLEGAIGGIIVLVIVFLRKGFFNEDKQENRKAFAVTKIIFNERSGKLRIGNREVTIPYATNQFYLVQAIFNKPGKRWETDELLKRFGEDVSKANGRKVYDTMVKVNKKVFSVIRVKLIINQNKTYQLNSSILSETETR